MTNRTLDRVKSYLEAKEGFTVLNVSKTPFTERATLIDCFGFVYTVDLTLTGRIKTDDDRDKTLKSESKTADK